MLGVRLRRKQAFVRSTQLTDLQTKQPFRGGLRARLAPSQDVENGSSQQKEPGRPKKYLRNTQQSASKRL